MISHHVQKGETMSSIVKKYGFHNEAQIFYANCNKSLRTFRNNAAQVKPGDTVNIPGDAVKAAEKKLASLQKIRKDYIQMNEEIMGQWERDTSRVKNVSMAVDVTATLIKVFKELAEMTAKGVAAMAMSGKALEEANEELAHAAIKLAYDPIKDVAKDKTVEKVREVKVEAGLWRALGKDALIFALSYDKPSYWAEKITGVTLKRPTDRL